MIFGSVVLTEDKEPRARVTEILDLAQGFVVLVTKPCMLLDPHSSRTLVGQFYK